MCFNLVRMITILGVPGLVKELKACPNHALSLIDGKAVVDKSLCILCGYCNPVCPEFAIRLI